MRQQPPPNRDAFRRFLEQFMEMVTAASVLGVIGVADRTGLLEALAGSGPMTADALAAATDTEPRYVLEALSALAAAGFAEYDPAAATFRLSPEAATCLADPTSPYYLAGWPQMLHAVQSTIPRVAAAFANGGGVPFTAYGDDAPEGIARMNGPALDVLLTRKWLPAVPEVVETLEAGTHVADIGCGAGAATIAMARAFPNSTFVGYDFDDRSIAAARIGAAGIGNASFEHYRAREIPLTPRRGFVLTFDAIHDMSDPLGALRRIHRVLEPDGHYLMVEPAAGDALTDNLNPHGALLYALSTLHCLPVSLAEAGPGLGTAWGPSAAARLAREAGFTSFERLDIDNPMHAFYLLRP